MSDSESIDSSRREAGNEVPWPGRSVERRHVLTALQQIQDVQRAAGTDVETALLAVNRTSVVSVDGAQYAGITTVDDRGRIGTLAPTHDNPRLLDDVQREVAEGPCLSAAWAQHTIQIDDLAEEMRWPRYRDAALARAPIRSVLSIRLATEGPGMAALNFYADTAGVFDDDSVEQGLIFASHTVVAWTAIDHRRQFNSALASRDVIGQAKGMLMERFDIDAVAAFDLLRALSQQSNLKLVTIAERVVTVGPAPSR